ncbi:MAG: peptidylprolyl isomerase [Treponema sp.]|jgi:hypothetical protein|nr:peptidylprolyl isomerase [Treponema sp.]
MASKAKKTSSESGPDIMARFRAHPFLFSGTVAVLVLVVVVFVFSPVMTDAGRREGESRPFGYYRGKPIAYVPGGYFDRAREEEEQFQRMTGSYMDGASDQAVWYQAFVRTLVHTAILGEMKKAGYAPPRKAVDRRVAELPVFQDEGGFSVVKYKNYDGNKRLSLWNSAGEDYIAEKYREDLGRLQVSSAEKAFINRMASPERTFEIVAFPRSMYPGSEVAAFAAANPEPFKMVHFYRITLSSEKEALQVLESIRSGKSGFEDAARNHSTDADKDKGGDMGIRMAHELFTELADEADRKTALSLKRDELSPALKAPNDNWIILRAGETPYGADLTQKENLDKVRNYMNRFEGGRLENWLAARAEEMLAGARERGLSLASYVESQKGETGVNPEPVEAGTGGTGEITTGTFGPVNLNYGNLGGSGDWQMRLFTNVMDVQGNSLLASAASNEHFWRTAFSTALNSPSSPFTLGDAIVVITPTEETVQDETAAANLAAFYSQGWMNAASDSDIRSVFFHSAAFENNFDAVFWSILFENLIPAR